MVTSVPILCILRLRGFCEKKEKVKNQNKLANNAYTIYNKWANFEWHIFMFNTQESHLIAGNKT